MGKFDEAADFQQKRANRAGCDLTEVENALVSLLAEELNITPNEDIFAGLLPPSIATGIGVEISGDWPGPDLRLRHYYAKCEGRDSDHERLRRRMSELAGYLPLRRCVSGGITFTAVFMEGTLHFDYTVHAGIKMATASLDIELHVEVNP